MTRIKRNAEEMFPLVESYLSSQVTQKEFSAEHGMSVAVLNYWLSKYRSESVETGAFLEIHPSGAVAAERPLLEVCYPHGVKLRIFTPLKPAYLDHLLSV